MARFGEVQAGDKQKNTRRVKMCSSGGKHKLQRGSGTGIFEGVGDFFQLCWFTSALVQSRQNINYEEFADLSKEGTSAEIIRV